jgi:hypothetical protein
MQGIIALTTTRKDEMCNREQKQVTHPHPHFLTGTYVNE